MRSARIDRATVRRIEENIIKFVSNGPTTLAQVHYQVADFAAPHGTDQSWFWETGDTIMWAGMTREGCAALRNVVLKGKVALQQSSVLHYFIDGHFLDNPNWLPVALAPAASANFRISKLLISIPNGKIDRFLELVAANNYRGLSPIKPPKVA